MFIYEGRIVAGRELWGNLFCNLERCEIFFEGREGVQPFQGWGVFWAWNPGRCSGLFMFQPVGLSRTTEQSGNDVFCDVAVDVGEAEVAAGVTVGEFFVVEAEEMEDRGVEIVDVDGVFDSVHPEFV